MLTVACVNVGNYLGRGNEYVAKLHNGINRHFNGDWDLWEMVDGPAEGWWNKIALFKPGTFETGTRVLYFDLDTIIVGSLKDLAEYDGEFAMLSDFYHPETPASGVMSWRVGEKSETVFRIWDKAGRPQFDPRGDGPLIGASVEHERLQDVYPGQIVSFKADCREGIPNGASVVCFHGTPRPHHVAEIMDGWQW